MPQVTTALNWPSQSESIIKKNITTIDTPKIIQKIYLMHNIPVPE